MLYCCEKAKRDAGNTHTLTVVLLSLEESAQTRSLQVDQTQNQNLDDAMVVCIARRCAVRTTARSTQGAKPRGMTREKKNTIARVTVSQIFGDEANP